MSQSEFDRTVAVDALALARKNEQEIQAHEDVCAERYRGIGEKIANISIQVNELKGILKWAGGACFTVFLAVFGLLINQMNTTNANLTNAKDSSLVAQQRIELLQDALARERGAKGTMPVPTPPAGQQP